MRGVRAAWPGTDMNLQFRVARAEPPPIRLPVVRRQLRSVGLTSLPVGDHYGKCVRWSDRFHAAELVVVVVIGRHRERKPRMGLNPIAQLVGQEFFGDKIGPALQENKWRGAGGEKNDVQTLKRSCRAREGPRNFFSPQPPPCFS